MNHVDVQQVRKMWTRCIVCGVAIVASLLATTPTGAQQYSTVDEALRAAQPLLQEMRYAESQAPLEAAIKLAKDDATRTKVYRALMPAYRLLPEIDKMLEAGEFIIEKSDREAERSLTRSSLLSFLRERGKADAAIARYDQRLMKNRRDATALVILAAIQSDLKKSPGRSAELLEEFASVQGKQPENLDPRLAAELAQNYVAAGKHEKGAKLYELIAPRDPATSAWHMKEAATAWLKGGDRVKAVAAAKQSAAGPPEERSMQLTYYWHRALADVFLDANEPGLAVPHYEQAIERTKSPLSIKDCQAKLAEAKRKAGGGK